MSNTPNNTNHIPVPIMLAMFITMALLVGMCNTKQPNNQPSPANPDDVAELVAYIKGEKKGSPPLSENFSGSGDEDENGKSTGSKADYEMEIPSKENFSMKVLFHTSTDAAGKVSSYLAFCSTIINPRTTVADAGLDGHVDWAHEELYTGGAIVSNYRASKLDCDYPDLPVEEVGREYLAKWQEKYNELVQESLKYFHKNLTEAPHSTEITYQTLEPQAEQEIESPEDFPPQSQK